MRSGADGLAIDAEGTSTRRRRRPGFMPSMPVAIGCDACIPPSARNRIRRRRRRSSHILGPNLRVQAAHARRRFQGPRQVAGVS